jgi:F0F1-type ATP synthase assembly protein I
MAGQNQKENQRSKLLAAAGQYTGYGLTWALSTLLFLLCGWWLDGKLGTMPLFLILGAFIGGGAGFYSLYRHIVLDPRGREKDGDP